MLEIEHSRKVSKKFIGNFISEESPDLFFFHSQKKNSHHINDDHTVVRIMCHLLCVFTLLICTIFMCILCYCLYYLSFASYVTLKNNILKLLFTRSISPEKNELAMLSITV